MKKVNKNFMGITMIFIVLLSMVTFMFNTSVATEGIPTDETLYIPNGSGTIDDPYIIDVSVSENNRVQFDPVSIPFNFVVVQDGAYEVDYHRTDSGTILLTFTLITSDKSDIKLELNEKEYNSIDNWQLGIKTKKRAYSSSIKPAYSIKELSSYKTTVSSAFYNTDYYMKPNGEIVLFSSNYEEYNGIPEDVNGDGEYNADDIIYYDRLTFGSLGTNKDKIIERSMKLSNIMYENIHGYDVENNNLYYFTNINKRKGVIYFARI